MPDDEDAPREEEPPGEVSADDSPTAAAVDPEAMEEMPEELQNAFPQAAGQGEIDEELEEVIEDLEEEYGEENVTESMIDAAYSEQYAEFIMESEDRMVAEQEKQSGKARFYIYREPKGTEDEFYLLKSPTPQEGKAEWLDLPRMNEEQTAAAMEEIIQTIMLYPSYDEVDWDYTGDGMYSPTPFTKREIVEVYFKHEVPSMQQPTDSAIGDAEKTAEVAKEFDDKPSL